MRGLGARCLSQADPHSVPWELGHLVRIQCAALGLPAGTQGWAACPGHPGSSVAVFVQGCSWKKSDVRVLGIFPISLVRGPVESWF